MKVGLLAHFIAVNYFGCNYLNYICTFFVIYRDNTCGHIIKKVSRVVKD